jgi:Ca-activated chloride channel family protein
MNDQNKRDQLKDELTKQQLREALGAEAPPDLPEQIIAAAGRQVVAESTAPKPTRVDSAAASSEPSWRQLAIAASLLLLVGGGLFTFLWANRRPQIQPAVASADKIDRPVPDDDALLGEIIAEEGAAGIDAVQARTRIIEEIWKTDVTEAIVSAEKKRATDPSVAEADLKLLLQSVKNAPDISEQERRKLASKLSESIVTAGRRKVGDGLSADYNKGQVDVIAGIRTQFAEATKRATEITSERGQFAKERTQLVGELTDRAMKLAAPTAATLREIDEQHRRFLVAQERTHQATGKLSRQETREELLAAIIAGSNKLQESTKDITAFRELNYESPDGQIVGVNQQNGRVWIDLGSADGLQSATTFSVYAHDVNNAGNAPPTKKASIQVVRIHGDHLAEARIVDVRADVSIVRDDQIFSPVFQSQEGKGPGDSGDQYVRIVENEFLAALDRPLSTFSIDVDTASYSNTRQFLLQGRRLPPPDAVRIEELVNYFDYQYADPKDDVPFASHVEVAACPWQPKHRLLRVALKGKEVDYHDRPRSNLVFLVDVSGSMQDSNKLPLVVAGLKLLAAELGENDQVAIAVYASAEGLVLPSTPGAKRDEIIASLDNLSAGGSTNGGAGIRLAYQIAKDNFVKEGINRVILCTDGDFNVGTTSTAELERLAEEKAKTGVFLTVLGFGRGNLNDAMMETISNKGNGNYAYIDGLTEAKKVLIEQMSGTLMTIAKDVKIQMEFNPSEVYAYRQIGYENRVLAAEDFNDDKKDAGEIGAGHSVTALYEIVPHPKKKEEPTANTGDIDELKYQRPARLSKAASGGELLTLKVRYKQPDGDKSSLLEFPVKDEGNKFGQASEDFRFASSVAAFAMLLRGSQYSGSTTIDAVLEIADANKGVDKSGYRAEFVELVREAKRLK